MYLVRLSVTIYSCSQTDRYSIHEDIHEASLANQPAKSTKTQIRRKHQTLPCKFFNSALGCTNGDTCAFLHKLVVPTSAQLVDKPRPWRTRPCRHFQYGRCTLGPACHFAHVYDPSCFNFAQEEDEDDSDDDIEIVSFSPYGFGYIRAD